VPPLRHRQDRRQGAQGVCCRSGGFIGTVTPAMAADACCRRISVRS